MVFVERGFNRDSRCPDTRRMEQPQDARHRRTEATAQAREERQRVRDDKFQGFRCELGLQDGRGRAGLGGCFYTIWGRGGEDEHATEIDARGKMNIECGRLCWGEWNLGTGSVEGNGSCESRNKQAKRQLKRDQKERQANKRRTSAARESHNACWSLCTSLLCCSRIDGRLTLCAGDRVFDAQFDKYDREVRPLTFKWPATYAKQYFAVFWLQHTNSYDVSSV